MESGEQEGHARRNGGQFGWQRLADVALSNLRKRSGISCVE
jgi:hypothetical protein